MDPFGREGQYIGAMRPCPSCGAPRADGVRCPACGGAPNGEEDSATLVDPAPLGALVGAREALLRTKVHGSPREPGRAGPSEPPAARTLVGAPRLDGAGAAPPTHRSAAPAMGERSGAKTLPWGGGVGPRAAPPAPPADRERAPAPPPALLEDSGASQPRELGETLLPDLAWQARRLGKPLAPERREKLRRLPAGPPKRRPEPTTWLLVAGAVLALFAVLLAAFWGRPADVTARVVADAEGKALLVVRCPGCEAGARLVIGAVEAPFVGGEAAVRLAAEPAVGVLRVPITIAAGDHRDDLTLDAAVPYRLRVDLTTLAGEHPHVTVLADLAEGVSLEVAGAPAVPLGEGRVSGTFDASDACAAPGDGPMIAEIPYVVHVADRAPEPATLRVTAERAPLHLESPGRRVVLEGPSFELAGSTAPGATLTVAGRPIAVRPTGVFRQTMNVSSPGRTQIEAKAALPGLAPRVVRIAVERVLSLDAAAAAFQPTITAAALLRDPAAATGQAVAVEGTVTGIEPSGTRTALTLNLGCAAEQPCPVRVMAFAAVGDVLGKPLRAFGTVHGAGSDGLAEIDADFTTRSR